MKEIHSNRTVSFHSESRMVNCWKSERKNKWNKEKIVLFSFDTALPISMCYMQFYFAIQVRVFSIHVMMKVLSFFSSSSLHFIHFFTHTSAWRDYDRNEYIDECSGARTHSSILLTTHTEKKKHSKTNTHEWKHNIWILKLIRLWSRMRLLNHLYSLFAVQMATKLLLCFEVRIKVFS